MNPASEKPLLLITFLDSMLSGVVEGKMAIISSIKMANVANQKRLHFLLFQRIAQSLGFFGSVRFISFNIKF